MIKKIQNVEITPALKDDWPISKKKLIPLNSPDCSMRTANAILEINELSETIENLKNNNHLCNSEREIGFNEGLKLAIRIIRDNFKLDEIEENKK